MRLTRVSGTIVVDGASNGRGAWLCRITASSDSIDVHGSEPDRVVVLGCLDAALGRKAFAKAWRSAVDEDDEREIRRALGRAGPLRSGGSGGSGDGGSS